MLEILGSLWIAILETFRFIIPHWEKQTVALSLLGEGEYEIICSIDDLKENEPFDAFMTIDSVFVWGNKCWPTITGEEPIYPAIMFHTLG